MLFGDNLRDGLQATGYPLTIAEGVLRLRFDADHEILIFQDQHGDVILVDGIVSHMTPKECLLYVKKKVHARRRQKMSHLMIPTATCVLPDEPYPTAR